MVTREDIRQAAQAVGICEGDILLVHSSFKSLGPVDGGAETVIAGLMDALGTGGTLVLPTFAQKNFSEAYETWYMDKPSDTGWLTEYFRTRPGSYRSDQATHSVAAAGAKAQWLTQTHGHTHKRFGNMGDTPFSNDSPWEKMYQENAKMLMLGVDPRYTTFRHYAEYVYVNELLARVKDADALDGLKAQLQRANKPVPCEGAQERLYPMNPHGIWPHVKNLWVAEQLEQQGKLRTGMCGEALFTSYTVRDFVDFVLHCLRIVDDRIFRYDDIAGANDWIANWKQWLAELEAAAEEKEK